MSNLTSRTPAPKLTDSRVDRAVAPNIVVLPEGAFQALTFYMQPDGRGKGNAQVGVAINPSMFIGATDEFVESLVDILRSEVRRVRTKAGTKPPAGDVQG